MTDGKLLSGQSLRPEQTLISVGGRAHLHYQGDGNLVVYLDGRPVWASHTDQRTARSLRMRRDGNLVVSDANGEIASTNTHGHPGAMVQLQDDGNFVIYEDPRGPKAGTPIWASSTGQFTVGDVAPEAGVPVGGRPFRDAAGILRLDNRTLVDDAGPFLGGSMTFFHGARSFVRDPAKFDADLGTIIRGKSDFPRIITDLPWPIWHGMDRGFDGPANIDAIVAMVDAIWDRGLRTQLTVLGGIFGWTSTWTKTWPYRLDSQAKRVLYFNQLGQALKGREEKIALWEVCNEPENGAVGPLGREDMAALGRLLKHMFPKNIVALGAPGGEGATSWSGADYAWYGDNGDMVLPHLDRGKRDFVGGIPYGWIHQGIHSAQDRFPYGSNEPVGVRSSVAEDSDPTRLRMGANATWFTRGAFHCYHNFSGLGLDGQSDYPLEHEPGAQNVFDAKVILPADLPNFQFHNWHWNSNPIETVDGFAPNSDGRRGTVRTLGMTSGHRVCIQVIRTGTQGATLRPRVNLRLKKYEHNGAGYGVTHEGDYDKGRSFELAPADEYIFVGTTR